MVEVQAQNHALIVDCPEYILKEESAQHIEHGVKYLEISTTTFRFAQADMTPTHARYTSARTHGHRQKKRVMKADEKYLAQSVGHLSVKTVKKSTG